MKTFEQYLDEARKEEIENLEEGKANVITSDKQVNPQPEGDPNKKDLTNPED